MADSAQTVKALAAEIKGFTPLSLLLPDIISFKTEATFLREYLTEFAPSRGKLTAQDFHQYAYGRLMLSKRKEVA